MSTPYTYKVGCLCKLYDTVIDAALKTPKFQLVTFLGFDTVESRELYSENSSPVWKKGYSDYMWLLDSNNKFLLEHPHIVSKELD